jgi:hypothetical protein
MDMHLMLLLPWARPGNWLRSKEAAYKMPPYEKSCSCPMAGEDSRQL